MQALPLVRCGLLLVLLASPALAQDAPRNLLIRTLTVPAVPDRGPPWSIYVAAHVVTTFCFEAEVDPAKTRLDGWEGRFAPPVIAGKKVVLEPRRDLGQGEVLPLFVTLVDGTELTFLLNAWDYVRNYWVDVQLNVYKNPDSYDAVLSQLHEAQKRLLDLWEENERLSEQVSSTDSSLAKVLLDGEVKTTSFKHRRRVLPKDRDMNIAIDLFSGVGKAAAVVELTNVHLEARWKLDRAYLTRDSVTLPRQPLAIRMDYPVIVPGESRKIAVVVDGSAFEMQDGTLADLVLEIFGD